MKRAIAPLAILLLWMLAKFMFLPANQLQLVKLACAQLNAPDCSHPDVEALASKWVALTSSASSLCGLAVLGTMGAVADAFGRKPPLMLATLGNLVQAATCLAIELFPTRLGSAWWPVMMVAFVVNGLMGTWSVYLMATFSYLADVTVEEMRPPVFTIAEALIGVGGVGGVLLGGVLAQTYGPWSSFAFISASFLLVLCAMALLPESLAEEHRQRMSCAKSNTLVALAMLVETDKQAADSAADGRSSSSRSSVAASVGRAKLRWLALSFGLAFLAFMGVKAVIVLFAKLLFQWDQVRMGEFLTAQNGARAGSALLLLPAVHRWVQTEAGERRVVAIGLLTGAAGIIWQGCARTALSLYGSAVVIGLGGSLPFGYLRGMMSAAVAADEQGRLLSAIGALEAVVGLLVPLISTPPSLQQLPRCLVWRSLLLLLACLLLCCCCGRCIAWTGGWAASMRC
eukprot:PLAT4630.1.p1 GENE.PLAT4630.1~~PLAT4630.1.p1  ORF type:complete len:456 (+),score=168.83 PLAT4630.1:1-1368(+)